MNELPFHTFLDLVSFDQETRVLEQRIEQLTQDAVALEQEHKDLGEKQAQVRVRLQECQRDVDSRELEMRILDEQESAKKKRLDTVASPKEYASVTSEIATIRQRKHDFEEVLLEAWKLLDAAKQADVNMRQQYEEKKSDFEKCAAQFKERTAHARGELDDRLAIRSNKQQGIPAEWLEKYAAMQMRVTNPVVPVERGMCSACFYQVTLQGMIRLRRRALIQCDECYRFLYDPALMERETTS